MNPQQLEQPVPFEAHERNAVRKRLAQLAVALGHLRLTAGQAAALIREQKNLNRTLAVDDSSH
jgi:hypothetical protein